MLTLKGCFSVPFFQSKHISKVEGKVLEIG